MKNFWLNRIRQRENLKKFSKRKEKICSVYETKLEIKLNETIDKLDSYFQVSDFDKALELIDEYLDFMRNPDYEI